MVDGGQIDYWMWFPMVGATWADEVTMEGERADSGSELINKAGANEGKHPSPCSP